MSISPVLPAPGARIMSIRWALGPPAGQHHEHQPVLRPGKMGAVTEELIAGFNSCPQTGRGRVLQLIGVGVTGAAFPVSRGQTGRSCVKRLGLENGLTKLKLRLLWFCFDNVLRCSLKPFQPKDSNQNPQPTLTPPNLNLWYSSHYSSWKTQNH